MTSQQLTYHFPFYIKFPWRPSTARPTPAKKAALAEEGSVEEEEEEEEVVVVAVAAAAVVVAVAVAVVVVVEEKGDLGAIRVHRVSW